MSETKILGFTIRTDLAYDLDHHLWIDAGSVPVRVGMDPLGVETAGTLSQLLLRPPGVEASQGDAVGSLEAEKFVGPVVTPLSGLVTTVNEKVMADPGLVGRDPYGEGWLYELRPTRPDELARLLSGEPAVVAAFEERIRRYRLEGVLAE
ncbi:MAG TPA: glycine cleavage system protein H [Acidimicrobiia bacterium]|nr:glycine cleavage system protein H [Acidimicrobiia bacterium]